ncbi:hypothetical protein Tco_0634606 [Tanacetum coccineum]
MHQKSIKSRPAHLTYTITLRESDYKSPTTEHLRRYVRYCDDGSWGGATHRPRLDLNKGAERTSHISRWTVYSDVPQFYSETQYGTVTSHEFRGGFSVDAVHSTDTHCGRGQRTGHVAIVPGLVSWEGMRHASHSMMHLHLRGEELCHKDHRTARVHISLREGNCIVAIHN